MSMETITVNKKTQLPWRVEMTITDILQEMRYSFPHIVVTVNGQLIRHDTYDITTVPPHADIRIVHLIAGG
jgi:sulfur carrier protein